MAFGQEKQLSQAKPDADFDLMAAMEAKQMQNAEHERAFDLNICSICEAISYQAGLALWELHKLRKRGHHQCASPGAPRPKRPLLTPQRP